MREPVLVEDIVLGLRQGLSAGGSPTTPVTIKCRIGTDEGTEDVLTKYDNLAGFVEKLSEGPAKVWWPYLSPQLIGSRV